ncbi:MAG: glycosyltransferase family 39 protein [Thermodesulfobacteriota bacterium]
MTIEKNKKTFAAAATAILIIAAFFLFYNLGDRLLWGDEAETALLGLNITEYGVPVVDDGRNVITFLGTGGEVNDSGLWDWSPWLDEYIAAGSFLLFGKSAYAARLPFALIALVSLLLFWRLAKTLYQKPETVLTALILLSANVPFLLHSRQCRYYSVLILAQIAIVYGFNYLLAGRGGARIGVAVVALALTAQFYCNYIVVMGNIVAITAAALILSRSYGVKLLLRIIVSGAIFFVLALPWLIYSRPGAQSEFVDLAGFWSRAFSYIAEIHFHIIPVFIFLIPTVILLLKKRRAEEVRTTKDTRLFMWLFIPASLATISIAPGVYFRYLMPLIPILFLLAAPIITDYIRPRAVRYILIALLCLTNLLSIISAYPVRGEHTAALSLPSYVSEITTNYENRLNNVVAYFNEHARSGDTVLTPDPEFPLIFHSRLRIIDSYRVNPFKQGYQPDFVISESVSGTVSSGVITLNEPLLSNYETVRLMVINNPRGDNRPDPHARLRFTATDKTEIILYKKRAR